MIDIDRLRRYLDDASEAEPWLRSLGVAESERGPRQSGADGHARRDARSARRRSATSSPRPRRRSPTPTWRSTTWSGSSPASRNPLATAALFERDPRGAADPAADLLHQPVPERPAGRRPRGYDLLRMTEGQPVAPRGAGRRAGRRRRGARATTTTCRPRCGASSAARRCGSPTATSSAASRSRRSRGRFRTWPTRSSKRALDFARRHVAKSSTASRCGRDGSRCRFVVLALGKLGGLRAELLQRHRPDVSVRAGRPDRRPAHRHATTSSSTGWRKDVIRLLTEPTDLGIAYRVDMRLRPEGSRGPLCLSFDSTLSYYDVTGRTWERQAFVKARPIAGDLRAGQRVSRPARAVDLSPLPEPGRHHRHQGAQAADRAARRARRRPTCAT